MRMRKNLLITAVFLLTISSAAIGQRYNMDVGFKVGASNYLGDIGGKDQTARPWVLDMKMAKTRWSIGGFFRYRFAMHSGINVGLTYFRVEGDDRLSTNPARRGRNLNFRNDVFDLSVRYEYTPLWLYLADVGNVGRYRTDFQAYLFAGVSVFYNNPKGQLNGQGEWYKLRPLMTEGEKYSPVSLSLPAGFGFYFTHNRRHRFGFEYYWAFTFTDYMDDISTTYADPSEMADDPLAAQLANQRGYLGESGDLPDPANYEPGSPRGDENDLDSYMLLQVSYSYTLKGKNSFYRSNYNWLYGGRGRFKRVKAKF